MKKTPLELQEKRYGGRRKGMKALLGVIFTVTLAVIALALWSDVRHREKAVNVPAPLPHNVNRRLSGYAYTRTDKGREVFTIHAAQTQLFGRGASMELDGVHVVVFGGEGTRHDEISTERCRYDTDTNALACSGRASVKLASAQAMSAKPTLEGGQPLFLETSDISYDPAEFTIETSQAVHFRYGPASGAAVGLKYNTRTGGLRLVRDVSLSLPQGAAGAGPAELSAGSLVYEKTRNVITLDFPVRFIQVRRNLTAASAAVFLDANNRAARVTFAGVRGSEVRGGAFLSGMAQNFEVDIDPATNQVRRLRAAGNVLLEERQRDAKAAGAASSQSLRRLTAQSVALNFAGPKSRPDSGEATGDVKLVSQPAPRSGRTLTVSRLPQGAGAGERVLSASDLVFSFGPHGVIKEAHTIGPGAIDSVSSEAGGARQTLTAGGLRMAFDALGRLEAVQGSSPARIVDQPPQGARGGSVPRISASESLLAKLDAGELESVEQRGDVNFEQGNRRARADQAFYQARGQQVALSGNPEVWDPEGRLRARHIQIDFETGRAQASGGVQSIHLGSPAGKPAGLAADSHALIVLADRMTADQQEQRAHYEGRVRAWRGPDVVETSSLDVYRKEQRLVTGRGVITSLTEPSLEIPVGDKTRDRTAATGAVQPVTIRADRLVYFNLGREAVYEGNVLMVSSNSAFRANRLEIYFSSADGSKNPQVEKAIADGNVRVTQEPGRRASGEHAEYFAASGKVVLTGGPPVIYDEHEGSLTGERLTFFLRDASLFADGGTQSQTVSKRRVPQQ